MRQEEESIERIPYVGIPKVKRLKLSLLEAPTGVVTLLERRHNRVTISAGQAQSILYEAVDRLDGDMADNLKTSPKIDSYLGRGFEAAVFAFSTKDGRWVMKVGLQKSCVPGLYSPSTDDYAAMMKWNYRVLSEQFSFHLPFVLPNPYFIVTPTELGRPTTIQFLPYVQKITNFAHLSDSQCLQLIHERQKFYEVSQDMRFQRKVMPDLFGVNNLVVGQTENDPHYVLIDMGLYNLYAPAPILNLWVSLYQKLALTKDIKQLQISRNIGNTQEEYRQRQRRCFFLPWKV